MCVRHIGCSWWFRIRESYWPQCRFWWASSCPPWYHGLRVGPFSMELSIGRLQLGRLKWRFVQGIRGGVKDQPLSSRRGIHSCSSWNNKTITVTFLSRKERWYAYVVSRLKIVQRLFLMHITNILYHLAGTKLDNHKNTSSFQTWQVRSN